MTRLFDWLLGELFGLRPCRCHACVPQLVITGYQTVVRMDRSHTLTARSEPLPRCRRRRRKRDR